MMVTLKKKCEHKCEYERTNLVNIFVMTFKCVWFFLKKGDNQKSPPSKTETSLKNIADLTVCIHVTDGRKKSRLSASAKNVKRAHCESCRAQNIWWVTQ